MDNLEIWIPAAVSVITLLVNMAFYLFMQPHIADKASTKEALRKVSVKLLNYLSDVVSMDSFEGVPTKIRKYSLQIHLYFKSGTAAGEVELLLEKIFKEVQTRKSLTAQQEIENWNDNFRNLVRDLRKNLAKYCGSL